MFRRKKSVNKKLLQHKLYLARETPEPVFDLSGCDLHDVPSGIYSLCKVFLKESLLLHNNQLSSLSGGGELGDLCLLKILDLRNNLFNSIPDEIGHLKNLEELYVNSNYLKKLPESICTLVNLKTLNISNNFLKYLPANIGKLVNLQKLNIRFNPNLKQLPKSICRAQRLILLELDPETLNYPPADIAEFGREAIMKYICNDVDFPYVPPEELTDFIAVEEKQTVEEVDHFQAKIWNLEKIKQQKLQDFLELERNSEILHRQEIELANTQKSNREKLVKALAEMQSKYDIELNKIQQEKEFERFRLIEQLQEAENNADVAINKLLALNRAPLEQLLENERLEEEKLLAAVKRYNETLRKEDILTEMQDILKQEVNRFIEFDQIRIETSRSILEQEMDTDSRLSQILHDKDMHQAELVSKLLIDDDLQKAALVTLLERGDARSWALLQQVRLVEAQLASLTTFELDRRKYMMDEHLSDLAEKRINLSILLSDLLQQQKDRRAELLTTLESLEEYSENEDDFWLRQYQRLLDKLPEGLSRAQKNIDPRLAEALLVNGVIHCLPFLAKFTQSQYNSSRITDEELMEAGVTDRNDRLHILDALHMYGKEKSICEEDKPSAPPLEYEEATAPLPDIRMINSIECVICLDYGCQIIFVPCGHLCCCSKCSLLVVDCPLCRSSIERKISMIP